MSEWSDADYLLIFLVIAFIILLAGAIYLLMIPHGVPPPIVNPPEPHMHP